MTATQEIHRAAERIRTTPVIGEPLADLLDKMAVEVGFESRMSGIARLSHIQEAALRLALTINESAQEDR